MGMPYSRPRSVASRTSLAARAVANPGSKLPLNRKRGNFSVRRRQLPELLAMTSAKIAKSTPALTPKVRASASNTPVPMLRRLLHILQMAPLPMGPQ